MTEAGKEVSSYLARRARWSPLEIAFWVFAFATIWLFPGKHLILTETAILALFALSLDLILGYAGIISLGQAAFFGLAGYTAGLLAKYEIINEPIVALLLAGVAAAALGFVTSFLVLRGSDLTRLMVTLGVALLLGELANRFQHHQRRRWVAGHQYRADLRPVPFRYVRPQRLHLLPGGFVHLLSDRAAHGLFAVRPVAALAQGQSAARLRHRHSGQPPADCDLHGLGRFRRHRRRAATGDRLLLARRAFARALGRSASRSDHRSGTGYLYGGLIGAVIYKFLQDWLASLTPQYWQFWIGFVLVVIVLIGRERVESWTAPRASIYRFCKQLVARSAPADSAASRDVEPCRSLETIGRKNASAASSPRTTCRCRSRGRPGTLIGPNGAGKTTVINLLTRRAADRRPIILAATILRPCARISACGCMARSDQSAVHLTARHRSCGLRQQRQRLVAAGRQQIGGDR
jgi:branched-chain amino acid transport system permease protein